MNGNLVKTMIQTSNAGTGDQSEFALANFDRERKNLDGEFIGMEALPREAFSRKRPGIRLLFEMFGGERWSRVLIDVFRFLLSTSVGGPAAVERGATWSFLPGDRSRRVPIALIGNSHALPSGELRAFAHSRARPRSTNLEGG